MSLCKPKAPSPARRTSTYLACVVKPVGVEPLTPRTSKVLEKFVGVSKRVCAFLLRLKIKLIGR